MCSINGTVKAYHRCSIKSTPYLNSPQKCCMCGTFMLY
nr:MAG TPA: hypothetical protein [Caudoviricetes sp.]